MEMPPQRLENCASAFLCWLCGTSIFEAVSFLILCCYTVYFVGYLTLRMLHVVYLMAVAMLD